MDTHVAILMGSQSDLAKIQGALDVLKQLEIPFQARVMSAHRTPERVTAFVRTAADQGIRVIIAAAGGAAHLAGAVAAHTTLPVIGIPVQGGALNGLDALLATVQMPGGIPVATVGIGRGGAQNAGLLAAAILALSDTGVGARLQAYREGRRQQVVAADEQMQEDLCT